MGDTYVIPDVHGRLDLLNLALIRIADHAGGRRATLVLLGDYIDRGPAGRQVIERLIGFRSETLKLIALKGNHEVMMVEACCERVELNWWIENGGGATLASYGGSSRDISTAVVPRSHLNWLSDLALMHVDRHRVYVHAGVDPAVPLKLQTERTLLWKIYPEGFGKGHGFRHVVHGHQANPRGPIVTGGKTNLDCMAWKTGRLLVGVFNDELAGGASEYLEIVGQSV
jgi:serine/threonine protein phosphatase 1